MEPSRNNVWISNLRLLSLGIELAGYHRQPGNERLITGIRQPTSTRALVLRLKAVETAIVSIEVGAVSRDFVKRVQARVANQVEFPAENVRICVTHTHSMSTLRYLRGLYRRSGKQRCSSG